MFILSSYKLSQSYMQTSDFMSYLLWQKKIPQAYTANLDIFVKFYTFKCWSITCYASGGAPEDSIIFKISTDILAW